VTSGAFRLRDRIHAMRDGINATRRGVNAIARGIHPIGRQMLLVLGTVNAGCRRMHSIDGRKNLA